MKLLKRFLINWQGLLAFWIILYIVGIAIAAPLIAPQLNPGKTSSFQTVTVTKPGYPNPPDAIHYLGTIPIRSESKQVDVFYSLIWGTRSALAFGLSAALIAATIGSLIGALSSYLGGVPGQFLLRIIDAFLAFPLIAGIVLFGQLIFPAYSGSSPGPFQRILLDLGVDNIMLALVCFSWMPYARVIHADLERIRQADFIIAAQAAGIPPARIIFRHLIPNTISNVITMAMRDVGGLVLIQSTFSFLGIGGGSDWGEILALGRNWILGRFGNPFEYWWVFLPVTGILLAFGIGWNLLGDYLSEWYNPRLRNFTWD
jgi:peptide/nickel transport system permease protein